MPKRYINVGDLETDSRSGWDGSDPPSEKPYFLSKLKLFNFEDYLNKNKIPVVLALSGLILSGLGVFLQKNTALFNNDKIEIIGESAKVEEEVSEIVVEIAGSVENPGVYKFKTGDRVENLMTACGGLSAEADREWVEKYINRAAMLADGQKIYIKSIGEDQETIINKQSDGQSANIGGGYQNASGVLGAESGTFTNINTATFAELDKLPGIGQVYGQKIIEQRPYSTTEELLSKGILPKTTYEKIKEKITTF